MSSVFNFAYPIGRLSDAETGILGSTKRGCLAKQKQDSPSAKLDVDKLLLLILKQLGIAMLIF